MSTSWWICIHPDSDSTDHGDAVIKFLTKAPLDVVMKALNRARDVLDMYERSGEAK